MLWLKSHGHWLLMIFVACVFAPLLCFQFSNTPATLDVVKAKRDRWPVALVIPGLVAGAVGAGCALWRIHRHVWLLCCGRSVVRG